MAVRAVALLVAIAAVPGCWLQAGGDASRRGLQPSEATLTASAVAGGLDVAWAADVGGPAAEPIVRGGLAFVRTEGAVTALDVDDGSVRWEADGLGGRAAPAWAEGRLWVPADRETCDLVGLDPATGAEVAHVSPFGGGGETPIVASYGTASCALTDALVVGDQVVSTWRYSGSAYIAFVCGRLMDIPLHLDGAGVVAYDIGAGTTWDSSTAVQRCGSPAGGVCPRTGETAVDGEVVAPPIGLPGGGAAWVTRAGYVTIVGPAFEPNGEAQLPGPASAPLAASASRLLVPVSGSLLTYPLAGCTADCTVWGGQVPPPAARPTTAGDVVWVGGGDGTVAALRERGCGDLYCEPVWEGRVGAGVAAPLVVDGGTLLVADTGGTITAFRLPA